MGCCCGGNYFIVPPCTCAPDGTPNAAVPCAVMRAKLEELLAALDPPRELPDVPCCQLACEIKSMLECGAPPEPPHPCYFIFDHPQRFADPDQHADKCYEWNVNNYCVGDPPPYSCGPLPDREVEPFEIVKQIDRHEFALCAAGCGLEDVDPGPGEDLQRVEGCCLPECPSRPCETPVCDRCPEEGGLDARFTFSVTSLNLGGGTCFITAPGGGPCIVPLGNCDCNWRFNCEKCATCVDSFSVELIRPCPILESPGCPGNGNFHCHCIHQNDNPPFVPDSNCFHKADFDEEVCTQIKCGECPDHSVFGRAFGTVELYCALWPDGERYWTLCGGINWHYARRHADTRINAPYCPEEPCGSSQFILTPCTFGRGVSFIHQGPKVAWEPNPGFDDGDPFSPRIRPKKPSFTAEFDLPRMVAVCDNMCTKDLACDPNCADPCAEGCSYECLTGGKLYVRIAPHL